MQLWTLDGRIWTWIRQEEATGVLGLPEDVPGSKVHVSIGVSTDPLLHSNHTGQPCILLSTKAIQGSQYRFCTSLHRDQTLPSRIN